MFGSRQKPKGAQIENPLLLVLRDADPDGAVTFRIDPNQVASPAEAGMILADAAMHFAAALTQARKAESVDAAMTELRTLLDAELNNPTQDAVGSLVN